MNSEFDELLRDGMERFTAELRAPANLAARARRSRRQRLTLRTAASGVAAAAVAAVAFAAVPSTMAPVTVGSPTVRIAERHDLEYLQLTRANRDSAQLWIYRGQIRQQISSPSGRPIGVLVSDTVKAKNGHTRSVQTIVDYQYKEWARGRQAYSLSLQSLSCHPPTLDVPSSPSALPAWIRGVHRLIKCGVLKVAGTEQINGIPTIKLKTTTKVANSPTGTREMFWVKRSDYAPVRMVARAGTQSNLINISWLPPTKANVAMLRVHIPSGFRQVPLSKLSSQSSETCRVNSSHPHKKTCTHSSSAHSSSAHSG
jgi:hypothetical protein